LTEALAIIGARRVRHPGCHRFCHVFGVTWAERRRVQVGGLRLPYPKRPDLDQQLELWTAQP
jgi:hypothetical protein